MRIDGVDLINNSAIVDAVIEFGTNLPTTVNPQDEGRLYVLTQTQGPNAPGLYLYNGTSWSDINNNTTVDAVTIGGLNSSQFLRSDQPDNITGLLTADSGIQVNDGSITFPSISFSSDSNSGIFLNGPDSVAITSGGILAAQFNANGTTFSNGVLSLQTTSPVVLLQDTNSTGAAISAYISLRDNTNSESAWIGFGSAANSDLTLANLIGNTVLQSNSSRLELTNNALFTNFDGTASLPAIVLNGDDDTGLYRSAVNELSVSTGGNQRVTFNSTGMTLVNGNMRVLNGAAAAPTYSFTSDTDSGIYLSGTDRVSISAGGVSRANFDVDGLHITTSNSLYVPKGTALAPSIRYDADDNTGMYSPTDNQIAFTTRGTQSLRIEADGYTEVIKDFIEYATSFNLIPSRSAFGIKFSTNTPRLYFGSISGSEAYIQHCNGAGTTAYDINLNPYGGNVTVPFPVLSTDAATKGYVDTVGGGSFANGTALNPSITFALDPDTGIYNVSANVIGFAAGGSQPVEIDGNGIKVASGSVSTPSYSFKGENTTGLYRPSASAVSMSITSSEVMRWTTTGVLVNGSSATNPSYAFLSDSNSGMYSDGPGVIGFSIDGTQTVKINSTGMAIGTTSAPINPLTINGTNFSNLSGGALSGGMDFRGATAGNGNFTSGVAFRMGNGSGSAGISGVQGGSDADTMGLSFFTHPSSLGADPSVKQMELTAAGNLRITDGVVSSPSFAFLSDNDTGFYRNAANTLGIVAGGNEQITVGTSNVNISTQLFIGANVIDIANTGVDSLVVDQGIYIRSNSANTTSFLGIVDDDTDLWTSRIEANASTNVWNFTQVTGNAPQIHVNGARVLTDATSHVNDGSVSTPSYSFKTDTDTGFYLAGPNQIGMAVNGAESVRLDDQGITTHGTSGSSYGLGDNLAAYDVKTNNNTAATWLLTHHNDDSTFRTGLQSSNSGLVTRLYSGLNNYLQLASSTLRTNFAGTAPVPAFSLNNDSNTGLYSPGNNQMAISAGGVQIINIATNGMILNSGQLLVPDGNVGSPKYTFLNDADTGIYRIGSGQIGVSSNGALLLDISPSRIDSTVPFEFPLGTAASPGLRFRDDTNTGLYKIAASQMGFTVDGVLRAGVYTTGLRTISGGIAAPSYSWDNDNNTGMYRQGADNVGFSAGGIRQVQMYTGGVIIDNKLFNSSGTVGSPSITFSGDTNTGIYLRGIDDLGFSTGGTEKLSINASGVSLYAGVMRVPFGTETSPAYSFENDSNNGIYRVSADRIAMSIASVKRTEWNGDQLYQAGGSAASPSYAFLSDLDSGMFSQTTNTIGISTGGVQRLSISSNGLNVISGSLFVEDGSTSSPSIRFNDDGDTGFYRAASGQIGFTSNGINILTMFSGGINVNGGALKVPNGSAAIPSLSFVNDNDTGIYSGTPNVVKIATGGARTISVSKAVSGVVSDVFEIVNTVDADGKFLIQNSANNSFNVMIRNSAANDGFVHEAHTGQTRFNTVASANSSSKPSISFQNDDDTGIYRSAANELSISTGGNQRFVVGPNHLQSVASHRFSAGTTAVPSLTFTNDLNTGIYNLASDQIGFTTNGITRVQITNNGLDVQPGSSTTPAISFIGDGDTGFYRSNVNEISVSLGGSQKYIFTSGGLNVNTSGTAAAPAVQLNQTNLGMYRLAADTIGLTTGGVERLVVGNSNIDVKQVLRGTNGSVTAPGFTFFNDPNTGMYLRSSDVVGFAMGGLLKLTINNQGLIVNNTSASSYGVTSNNVSYDIETPTNSSATWLLTHHNTDNTLRAGLQSLNNGDNFRFYNSSGLALQIVDSGPRIPDGTSSGPSLTFINDANTGLYRPGSDILGLVTGGLERARLDSTGLTVAGAGEVRNYFRVTNVPGEQRILIGNQDSGGTNTPVIMSSANGNLVFGTGSTWNGNGGIQTPRVSITSLGLIVESGQLITQSGSVSVPSLTFYDNSNTGLYNYSNDSIGFTVGGVYQAHMNTSGLNFRGSSKLAWDGAAIMNAKSSIHINIDSNNDSTNNQFIIQKDSTTSTGTALFSVHENGTVTIENGNLDLNNNSIINTSIQFGNGSAVSPSITFSSDPNTGIYSSANDNLAFSTGGVRRGYFHNSGMTITSGSLFVPDGNVAIPGVAFSADTNTGMFRLGENVVGFAAAGVETFRYWTGGIQINDGTAAVPSMSFTSDGNTGIYKETSDAIGFTTGGVRRAYIHNNGIRVKSGKVEVPFGTAALPSYSFDGDQNTGLYNISQNVMGLSTAGITRISISESLITSSLQNVITKDNTSPHLRLISTNNNNAYIRFDGNAGDSQSIRLEYEGTDTALIQNGYALRIRSDGSVPGGTAHLEVEGITYASRFRSTSFGTAGSPSFSFHGDNNTGCYLPSYDNFAITCGSTERVRFGSYGTRSNVLGSASTPAYSFLSDPNTGMYRVSSDVLGLTAAGVNSAQFVSTGIRVATGSGVTTPGYSFISDTNSGMYSIADGHIGFSTNGVKKFSINQTLVECSVPLSLLTNKITNLGTPTSASDAATKDYVDSLAGSGSASLKTNLASQTIDGGANTTLTIECDNEGAATLNLMGTSQGTGILYVGQSATHGGGIEYNGDSVPVTSGAGSDYIALYRRSSSVNSWTARNIHSDNDWQFRNKITSVISAVGSGTSAAPSMTFSTDTDTGFYRPSSNQIAMTFGGVRPYTFNAGGIEMLSSTDSFYIGKSSIRSNKFSFDMVDNGLSTLTISGNNTNTYANGTVRSRIYLREGVDGTSSSGRAHGLIEGLVESGDNNDYNSNLVFSVWEDVPTNGVSSVKEVLRLKESGLYLTNHETTGSASNAYIDLSTGQLLRSTSSERYKKDIFELTDEMADKVFDMLPVTYFSDIKDDDQSERHLGFTAEQLDNIGLHELVVYKDYGDGLIPEAVNYDRVSVLLTYIIKKQHKDLTEMKIRLERLEQHLGLS